jgi:hypothetical protein
VDGVNAADPSTHTYLGVSLDSSGIDNIVAAGKAKPITIVVDYDGASMIPMNHAQTTHCLPSLSCPCISNSLFKGVCP